MSAPIRLGTRRSALAMTQSRPIADAIAALSGREVELVPVTTHGDSSTEALAQIGGTGVFVGALREALLTGGVDVAVHSLKDLPTADPAGIVLAAVPQREDPRDALVARDGLTLGELPSGSLVGTGSPRRAAQLRALGFGLEVVPVRGNVDTRVGLVGKGEVDAVVLARAGLARLGLLGAATEVLDPIQMLPAPGQGALAVECRQPDTSRAGAASSTVDNQHHPHSQHHRTELEELLLLLGQLDDAETRLAVTAERTLLATLEAGCSAPVGAYGEPAEGEHVPELYLRAVVVSVDGTASVRLSASGPLDEAARIGRDLATELLAEGAADLIQERVT